jgi:phosphoribosylaminoimidazole-succinocarboxamide synthase
VNVAKISRLLRYVDNRKIFAIVYLKISGFSGNVFEILKETFMGSVKDLTIKKNATTDTHGRARFIFSDRYSVFDWGEMPDHIPNKGASIALLGAYFFERLATMGIRSHYVGLVEDNQVKRLSEIRRPTNVMEVKLVRVVEPPYVDDQYDYSVYKREKGNFLIPLEVIYRNSLPPGSSVFKRLKEGQITPRDLGLDKEPVPHQKLKTPILDVSTKLEITDRYLTWSEAREMTGMTEDELAHLMDLVHTVNDLITDEFSKIGFLNEDGKIEVGFDEKRRLMVVDVVGTLDECRFTYNGIPVSKEIARVYYRTTDWFQAVEEAKKKDRQHWKEICRLAPDPLPPQFRLLVSQIYSACTNEVTGKTWFEGIPPLKNVLDVVKRFI